jgi:hypothetical protein
VSVKGAVHLLDFGSALNAKFQAAFKVEPGSGLGFNRPYEPISHNCGMPFNRAINTSRKEIGLPRSLSVLPSGIKEYIEKNLVPRGYVPYFYNFPKH